MKIFINNDRHVVENFSLEMKTDYLKMKRHELKIARSHGHGHGHDHCRGHAHKRGPVLIENGKI